MLLEVGFNITQKIHSTFLNPHDDIIDRNHLNKNQVNASCKVSNIGYSHEPQPS